jgi:hypothetical protein
MNNENNFNPAYLTTGCSLWTYPSEQKALTRDDSLENEYMRPLYFQKRLHETGLPLIEVYVNEHKVNALIDTGATTTVISSQRAIDLQLNKSKINNDITTIAKGVVLKSIGYSIKFNWILNDDGESKIQDGFPLNIDSVDFPNDRKLYDMIIGRDVLRRVSFEYAGMYEMIIIRYNSRSNN